MTSYVKFTRQIGDQSVSGLERTGDALIRWGERFADVRDRVDLPQVRVPAPFAKLQSSLPALPRPSEIIEANLELTTRLLTAQNAVALKVLGAAGPAKRGPAPVKKSTK